jgi:hypothetical protein
MQNEGRAKVDNGTDQQPPKVFVSYSWDTPEHSNWVLRLATRLLGDGIDITLDQWDLKIGDDVAYFMEKAAKIDYRVLAIVSTAYVTKTNEPAGGAGYEKRLLTKVIMKDLASDRLVPILRENPDGELPDFMGTPWFCDMRNDDEYEKKYFELLSALHRKPGKPKPPLGPNPFEAGADDVAIAVRHSPARYVEPALQGTVTFDYSNNNGQYVIGAGDRKFTLRFGSAGTGRIHLYNDPKDIQTVALAAGIAEVAGIGDASIYDGSSRHRVLRVGDAGVLRNDKDYWAAVFVDNVDHRSSSEPSITFRFSVTSTPNPQFPTEATPAT